MDLKKTVTLTNFKVSKDKAVHFDAANETTRENSSNFVQYDESAIENLAQLHHSYNLGEKFAEGGQGEILTGTDKLLKRFVAIKSLKKKFYTQPEVVNSFISEAIVTAQLEHPAIIPIYGVSKDTDDAVHLSMKLVVGKNLRELIEDDQKKCQDIKSEHKALFQRLEYFASACDAINYAHEKKILHRDLKPENIMIGTHHDVYVMDWGIAKMLESDEIQETEASISGTPGYIAPEILCHEPYNGAIDQFSLGIILFEIITLKYAITATSLSARLVDTIDGKLPPFTHHNPKIKVSPDLIAICKKATHLDPKQRYATVKALAHDIRLFISHQEVEARPDNAIRAIYRFISAHRNKAAILILFILLVSAGSSILSLKAQYELIKETKNRELKLLDLRSAIEQKSHKIDRHFLTLANLLQRYGDKISALMEDKKSPENSTNLVQDYHLFKASQTTPLPGTENSIFYKQLINPNFLSFKRIDNNSPPLPENFSPLKEYSLSIIAQSGEFPLQNSERLKQQILENGLPICWLYCGFENGLIITYPAHGALEDNYDPRQRPWYQQAKQNGKLLWTEPYEDLFGLGTVISAVQPIYDTTEKKFSGVAAFDLTLNYTKEIMNSGKSNPALLANYLLDKNGKIIISGKDSQILNELDKSKLISYLNAGEKGRYEVTLNGKKIMIDFASISTLSWYYIELIDIEKYLQFNNN